MEAASADAVSFHLLLFGARLVYVLAYKRRVALRKHRDGWSLPLLYYYLRTQRDVGGDAGYIVGCCIDSAASPDKRSAQ